MDIKKVLVVFIGLSLILPAFASAQDPPDCNGDDQAENCDEYCKCLEADPDILPPDETTCVCNPLKYNVFEDIIEGLINFLFKIGIALAPLMIIIGGFLFVTAGGNIEQVNRAKKIIIWTLIGFLIVLLAQGIMNLIEVILGIK